MPESLSLPITNDWKSTLKRWGAELRKKIYLTPSAFYSISDWSPNVLTSYTSAFGTGTLTFANVEVRQADYWVPPGGNICFFNLQITFDISAGTDAYVGITLPADSITTTYGQGCVAQSHFGTTASEKYLVNAPINTDLMFVSRRPDATLNQWTVSTDSSIIVSGHYRIEA